MNKDSIIISVHINLSNIFTVKSFNCMANTTQNFQFQLVLAEGIWYY